MFCYGYGAHFMTLSGKGANSILIAEHSLEAQIFGKHGVGYNLTQQWSLEDGAVQLLNTA